MSRRKKLTDLPSALLTSAALVALVRYKVDPTWLRLGGALVRGARALLV
jgi:hypothetical protein